MNKRSKIEANDGELELPQPVIQQIQSLLSRKEAAMTTLVSKSWYGAWLIRPHLDFDQRYFRRVRDGFSESVNNTLQRYDELNLKIDGFRLCVNNCDKYSNETECISKALRLGATDLEFVDLYRETFFGIVLPNEVIGSENLVRLCTQGCEIDLGKDGEVKCWKLKYLSFKRMYFKGDVIWDIISNCPSIEELTLSDCMSNFKDPTYDVFTRQMVRILPSSPFNDSRILDVGSIIPYEFCKLKYLVLERVRIVNSFFSYFSLKFPCLMELTVHDCAGYNQVEISSTSLKYISFVHDKALKAKFDVPRIHDFRMKCHFLPDVCFEFENPPNDWFSNISLVCDRPAGVYDYARLRKFLTELSMSKISLYICFSSFSRRIYNYSRNVEGLPKPLLENLEVSVGNYWLEPSLPTARLDVLIWSCRPKFITQNWYPESNCERANRQLLDLFCKTLVHEESENCYVPNRNMLGFDELKEVNLDIYDESVADWVPLPWKTLLDASAFPEKKREIRFQLVWN